MIWQSDRKTSPSGLCGVEVICACCWLEIHLCVDVRGAILCVQLCDIYNKYVLNILYMFKEDTPS